MRMSKENKTPKSLFHNTNDFFFITLACVRRLNVYCLSKKERKKIELKCQHIRFLRRFHKYLDYQKKIFSVHKKKTKAIRRVPLYTAIGRYFW